MYKLFKLIYLILLLMGLYSIWFPNNLSTWIPFKLCMLVNIILLLLVIIDAKK